MNVQNNIQIHRDHREWTADRASWHDDVRVWQEEVDVLRSKLRRIESFLDRQKRELRVHAAALRLYGACDAKSEHQLAQCEKNGDDERKAALVHVHDAEASRQLRQWQRHGELKAFQRRLIVDLMPLAQIADRLPSASSEEIRHHHPSD